ncbi:MAG: MerR family transcriptional regulator [Rikenellaceae bacterium]|nr:MerR family transcriptional regulator [Rikenellaceae bacterium]MDY3893673.1 MerR family transcriptional regulator [Candidatus Cryptobacteroides sp.]
MEKQFFSIGEVAELLGENNSTVRFWSNSFPRYVRPTRTPKGDRVYRSDDIRALELIRYLLKSERLTIEGATKRMDEDRKGAERKQKIVQSLTSIRKMLTEVAQNL